MLYNISIKLYLVLIRFSSLFNIKAKLWLQGRKDIFHKLAKATKTEQNIVWFHCASLGEFEQGKPIIEAYKQKETNCKILLTFFSPSGYEVRKDYKGADWVFYLPADTKANAKEFVSIVNPTEAFFIKYEFWLNYMAELKKKTIPLYIISATFRKEQIFFKYKWVTKQLHNVSHFFVQDQNSKELLKTIGFRNCTVAGDTRFDSVMKNIQNRISIPLIERFSKNKTTIICGSTWAKDEDLLAKYIKHNPNYNYIIAPHELRHISDLKKQTDALLYSKANEKNILMTNVLIIDSIGILSNIYKYGDLAYIGGGFGNGIHNVLEAVTFGLPVIFGPNHQKSNEAIELINKQGAISISNYTELTSAVAFFSAFDKSIATDYIEENSGATEKILNYIF